MRFEVCSFHDSPATGVVKWYADVLGVGVGFGAGDLGAAGALPPVTVLLPDGVPVGAVPVDCPFDGVWVSGCMPLRGQRSTTSASTITATQAIASFIYRFCLDSGCVIGCSILLS